MVTSDEVAAIALAGVVNAEFSRLNAPQGRPLRALDLREMVTHLIAGMRGRRAALGYAR